MVNYMQEYHKVNIRQDSKSVDISRSTYGQKKIKGCSVYYRFGFEVANIRTVFGFGEALLLPAGIEPQTGILVLYTVLRLNIRGIGKK